MFRGEGAHAREEEALDVPTTFGKWCEDLEAILKPRLGEICLPAHYSPDRLPFLLNQTLVEVALLGSRCVLVVMRNKDVALDGVSVERLNAGVLEQGLARGVLNVLGEEDGRETLIDAVTKTALERNKEIVMARADVPALAERAGTSVEDAVLVLAKSATEHDYRVIRSVVLMVVQAAQDPISAQSLEKKLKGVFGK